MPFAFSVCVIMAQTVSKIVPFIVIEAQNAIKLQKRIDEVQEEIDNAFRDLCIKYEDQINRVAYREGMTV